MRIHYVTNDPDDQIFVLAEKNPRIFPYYIGEQKAITLMMKMDADVVVATLEDLENYYLKRSYVRKDTEYVFFFHHMTSTHLTPHEDAFDHYDAIFCAGPHQVAEIEAAERKRGLKPKRLVKGGYDLLDQEIADYEALAGRQNERPVILIGPSWQEGNILDSCADELIGSVLGKGYRIIVRPHPEYTKRYAARWEALQARWAGHDPAELYFESDFSSNESTFSSDILVTDWSSISCDFSFSTLKPTIFIDTPMKVGNPRWEELGLEPTDISLRNQIGRSLALEEVDQFADEVASMLAERASWHDRIRDVRAEFVYNLGRGAEVAGEFLLETVLAKQAEREGGKVGKHAAPASAERGEVA